MKETLNISLSGISFIIEKDAYEQLQNYIETIEAEFTPKGSEGKEIIDDIEARMAEILLSDTSLKPIITSNDVDKLIQQMGYPESDNNNETDKPYNIKRPKRKLYRKKEGAVLGGVINGIGTYFDVNVPLIRIAFVLLLFGLMMFDVTEDSVGYNILIYIVCWISIPQAKTVIQKLEMEGGDISVSSIGNRYDAQHPNNNSNIDNIFASIIKLIGTILKFILIAIIGFISIVLGLVLITVIIAFIGIGLNFNIINSFVSWEPTYTFIATIIATIIPIVLLILLFIKALFGTKTHKSIYFIAIPLWIAATIFAASSFFTEVTRSKSYDSKTETIYSIKGKNKIYVKTLSDGNNTSNPIDYAIKYKQAHYDYDTCHDSTFKVTLTRSSNGFSKDETSELIETIELPYEIKNDTLYISTGFTLKDNIKIKNQFAYYTFYCPVNSEIIFDRSIKSNGKYSHIHKDGEEHNENNESAEIRINGKKMNKHGDLIEDEQSSSSNNIDTKKDGVIEVSVTDGDNEKASLKLSKDSITTEVKKSGKVERKTIKINENKTE